MNSKPYVVYWNNIPSPYIVDRFNAVSDRGEVNFEAWFNDRIEPDRSWDVDESTWRFKYRYVPSTRIANKTFHWPTPILSKKPDVIISLYAEPSFLVGWFIAKLRNIKTAFWCQVTYDSWVKRRFWKDAIKRFVFSRVDATLGSGQESREFAMRYGTKPENAMLLLHSIDIKHFQNGRESVLPQRDDIRYQYGLTGTVFIYVGRLWSGKGLEYLLDAFSIAQKSCNTDISLLLVGDGPEESNLRKKCELDHIHNVVFTGFIQKCELPTYYTISDVFVFPTLGDPYGTVVDEAMACSLPIISTSTTGEIHDRVKDDINGYVVPPEDSKKLAERMLYMANNPDLPATMGKISAELIADRTLERWAEDLGNIVNILLKRR